MRRVIYACVVLLSTARADIAAQTRIDLTRDIQPILANHCLQCHGPNKVARKAGLRLDHLDTLQRKSASGRRLIVAGQPNESELYLRVTSTDDDHMPPADAKSQLSPAQIASLNLWIQQGANWESHWAYTPVKRPAIPIVRDQLWPRNAIDHFVLQRHEQLGMNPAEEADRVTLIRRVTFDLIGLPPTPAEIEQFLSDTSPRAYERLVDRLLESPKYGERMATPWLDLARYADTHGYHIDSHRDMWRWRDWVIHALNDNMPFDQFTISQLAGDLLPSATLQQRIATGLHRNGMINFEEGAIPAEYLNEYISDRVTTTATIWLGQTMECARCHDHKYDPFTQRDFYQLYAFFNSIDEEGLDGRDGNAQPWIDAPTSQQLTELNQYRRAVQRSQHMLTERAKSPDFTKAQKSWEQQVAAGEQLGNSLTKPTHYLPLDNNTSLSDGSKASVAGTSVAGTSVAGTSVAGPTTWIPGKTGGALLLGGSTRIDWPASDAQLTQTTFGGWIFPTTEETTTVAAKQTAADGISLQIRKLIPTIALKRETQSRQYQCSTPLELRTWTHVMASVNLESESITWFVNGKQVSRNEFNRNSEFSRLATAGINGKQWHLGGGEDQPSFRGLLDEFYVFDQALSPFEVARIAGREPILDLLRIAAQQRTPAQRALLRNHFMRHHDKTSQRLLADDAVIQSNLRQLQRSMPTTMVMKELPQPRPTHILRRGDYRQLGEAVTASTPAALPAIDQQHPPNRLALARWLVHPENPLTSRVTVNRYWSLFFGRGIVATEGDFGSRGTPPTHPKLLDWLADEFVQKGWNVKQLHRLIATSATYRQANRVSLEKRLKDPDNVWLARTQRLRLPAEVIRDNALQISGLLVEKVGGPSVYPYQPTGLWRELS
ncbi:MAG: mono/diheme cytochrome c family protein, partial [Pirellulaceae bacterium]